jgi:serine protease
MEIRVREGTSDAMSSVMGNAGTGEAGLAVAAILGATTVRSPDATAPPARFALILKPAADPVEQAAAIAAALAPVGAQVTPLSTLDPQALLVEIADRTLSGDNAAAFAAAHALQDAFDVEAAEPDLPTNFFPVIPPGDVEPRSADLLPIGCRTPREDALDQTPMWALDAIRVPQAWAFSEAQQRPDRGAGVIVAQPDTGITQHAELEGILTVPGFDVLDGDPDPTDPLEDDFGDSPGHGTATASVLVSLPPGRVTGSAPSAQHMAIRAIESVVRITQISVAQAIDWAAQHGAHVITLSLGGLPSFTLLRALQRAVQADIIVMAAAGNCVGAVVWPARYDDCIAVAGVDVRDARWRGSCHGPAVDVSAPGENVFCATVPTGSDQAQGTSYSVALTAGVAALWLAHHSRANLIAAARDRGETLQVMFRRLVSASARRPAGWDPTDMGGGIVDAQALLAADLDLRRDPEAMVAPIDPRNATARTVESLVAEMLGPEATHDPVDWYRHGPEIAAVLLQRRLDTLPTDADPLPRASRPAPAVSPELTRAVTNPVLRAGLGLAS